MRYFQTAGLIMGVNLPDNLIDSHFLPFELEGANFKPDMLIEPGEDAQACLDECEDGEKYYPCDEYSVTMSRGGDVITVQFSIPMPFSVLKVDFTQEVPVITIFRTSPETDVPLTFSLFDTVKGGVFTVMQRRGYYILHSASVIENGKVYAFTALSGTGKSTHANLWEKVFGLEHFNGDMFAVKAGEVPVVAYGTPWCGDSGKQYVGSLPLGGLFFLYRDSCNHVEEADDFEKLILLAQRMWAINFTDGAFEKICNDLADTAAALPCAKLYCLPDEDAAITAHEYAVKYMNAAE